MFVAVFLVLFLDLSSGLDLCRDSNLSVYDTKTVPETNCGCLDVNKCPRFCCKLGFNLQRSEECQESPVKDFNLTIYKDKEVVFGRTEPPKTYLVGMPCSSFFKLESFEDFFLQNDGSLWVPYQRRFYRNDEYCLDGNVDGNQTSVFVCFEEEEQSLPVPIDSAIRCVGMIISMPFLLCTFIVYALLPERNLHMKALMCYVLSLFFGYLFLVSVQLASRLEAFCEPFAVGILFFFLSSFLWMNVICMDIWFTFSGMRGFSGSIRMAEKKRFIFYSIYAYGTAFFLTIIVLIMNHVSPSNAWYNPSFGESSCFIMQHYPLLLYFYGPMALLICANSILFGLTAWKIAQMRRDTKMLRREESQRHSSAENDQRKFFLYLKLLLAMGVNWSMEVISWAVEWNLGREKVPSTVWILTDFCNAIYGLFIFILFVCKPKIWQMLKKRLCGVEPGLTTQHTGTTSKSDGSTIRP